MVWRVIATSHSYTVNVFISFKYTHAQIAIETTPNVVLIWPQVFFVISKSCLCLIVVGLVSGSCLADFGNTVRCVDIDAGRIDLLNGGGIPIYEPGLKEMVSRNVESGRLTFTLDLADAVANSDVIFVAVGTPSRPEGIVNAPPVSGVGGAVAAS